MNYEQMAWDGKFPLKASSDNVVLYCVARTMYEEYRSGRMTKETANQYKENALIWIELVRSLAHSNAEIIKELCKLTAPRRDLAHKDKNSLLEVINRIEALVTGLMKSYKGKLPDIFKEG